MGAAYTAVEEAAIDLLMSFPIAPIEDAGVRRDWPRCQGGTGIAEVAVHWVEALSRWCDARSCGCTGWATL